MIEHNDVIKFIYNAQKKYCFIEEFHLFRDLGSDSKTNFDLSITLSEYPKINMDKIINIKFINLRKLKIKKIDGLLQLFLAIEDISSYQQEAINFRVCENEHEMFSFECQNIIILEN